MSCFLIKWWPSIALYLVVKLQWLHSNFEVLCVLLMCFFNFCEFMYFPHVGQAFLSALWVFFMCAWSLTAEVKLLPHTLQDSSLDFDFLCWIIMSLLVCCHEALLIHDFTMFHTERTFLIPMLCWNLLDLIQSSIDTTDLPWSTMESHWKGKAGWKGKSGGGIFYMWYPMEMSKLSVADDYRHQNFGIWTILG